jgi:hypothetical protein
VSSRFDRVLTVFTALYDAREAAGALSALDGCVEVRGALVQPENIARGFSAAAVRCLTSAEEVLRARRSADAYDLVARATDLLADARRVFPPEASQQCDAAVAAAMHALRMFELLGIA